MLVLPLRISENSPLVYPKLKLDKFSVTGWREPILVYNGPASKNATLYTYHDVGENSLPLLRCLTVKFNFSPPN